MRWLASLALVSAALAQDPFTVAPRNYKLEFENEYVRLVRVTYRPGDKLDVHSHPETPTIYIYTTDGGPIKFFHNEGVLLTRRAVKAGALRFNRGAIETHASEYEGDRPSEYIRIELKTEPLELPRPDLRIPPDKDRTYESKMVRISKTTCAPGQTFELPKHPAVVVSMPGGQAIFYPANSAALTNTTEVPLRHILIELLSPPRQRIKP